MKKIIFSMKSQNSQSLEELGEFLSSQEDDIEVEFYPGVFYGTIRLNNLKCKSLKLIGHGMAALSGVRKIDCSFTSYNDEIIVATIEKDLDFQRLKVNGEQRIMARYPDYDEMEILAGYTSLKDIEQQSEEWGNLKGSFLRGLHVHEWGGNSYKVIGKKGHSIEKQWIGDNNRGSELKEDCVLIENCFDALSSEKEWFYDKNSGELFLYDTVQDNMNLSVEISEKINLLSIENCHNTRIEIDGIDFVDSERSMFKMPWMRYLRSDWAFNFGSTLEIKDSSNVTINDCNFSNLGSNCIGLFGNSKDINISNCDFVNSNTNGILILGDESSTYCTSGWDNDNHLSSFENPDKTGAATDKYPKNISIECCYFYNLGLEDKQSAGVCISLSHKVKILKSTFHHLPRSAINICENAFGGHVVEDCDLFDCVRETCDHGPFNSWGRDRFWSLGGFNTSGRFGKEKREYALADMLDENVIRHNRIVGSRGFGIDLDDGSSNYLIEDNLCFNKGIKLREGFFRKVRNNIIIGAPIDLHATFAQNDDQIYNNIVVNEKPIQPIILNKGFTTKIFDNYFLNAKPSSKKEKLLKNQINQFENADIKDILQQNFTYKNFKKIDMDFGKAGKPTPHLFDILSSKAVVKIKNKYGNFSSIDDFNRSMAGAKSYDGLYVEKIKMFSPLKKLGVKKDDVIISVNGEMIVGTDVCFEDFKKPKCTTEVIRQQKSLTIGTKSQ